MTLSVFHSRDLRTTLIRDIERDHLRHQGDAGAIIPEAWETPCRNIGHPPMFKYRTSFAVASQAFLYFSMA